MAELAVINLIILAPGAGRESHHFLQIENNWISTKDSGPDSENSREKNVL